MARAKLSEAQVRQIRRKRKGGATISEIAEKFGIGRREAGLIVSGRRWSKVSELSLEEGFGWCYAKGYDAARGESPRPESFYRDVTATAEEAIKKIGEAVGEATESG